MQVIPRPEPYPAGGPGFAGSQGGRPYKDQVAPSKGPSSDQDPHALQLSGEGNEQPSENVGHYHPLALFLPRMSSASANPRRCRASSDRLKRALAGKGLPSSLALVKKPPNPRHD